MSTFECELLNLGDFNHVLMWLHLKPIKQIIILSLLWFVIYAVEPLTKLRAIERLEYVILF